MKNLRKQKINILFTAIIICVSIVAVGLVYAPRILDMDMFVVETGSMSPTIKANSLIYVKGYDNFEDYNVGDIVLFTDNSSQKSFTHRIVEIDTKNLCFTTKGDANKENDVGETSFEFAKGKVVAIIPYAGYLARFLRNNVVKVIIILIYVVWAAIEIELYRAGRKKAYE